MKLFICTCLLVFVTNSFVSAKSFNFRDLFLSSDDSTSPSLERTNRKLESERSEDANTSFPSDNQNELDSDLFSSEEESHSVIESLNSSDSDIIGVSVSSTSKPPDNESVVSKEESTEEPLSSQSPSSSSDFYSSFASSTVKSEEIAEASKSSLESVSTSGSNESVATNDPEEVVLGTTETTTGPLPKTIYQKSVEWVEDTYTLSILIPIAAGILFATACIITVALCRCLRRCCRRRRFKRKVLPDSVKNLRPSDRARLLGDCSSDEEFN